MELWKLLERCLSSRAQSWPSWWRRVSMSRYGSPSVIRAPAIAATRMTGAAVASRWSNT